MSQKLKYPYIAEQIIHKIENGEYPVNSELPTLDELTKLYGVSRMTAQRALKILSQKGYVAARRGNKTRIISHQPVEKLSVLKGKHIGMIGNYTVETFSTATMPLKLLYFLQQKLTDLDNHVMCFQYVDNLDLRADDFDCYVMVDLLGARHKFNELLEKTGKPYVIVEAIGSEGCLHNHIHPLFDSVLLRLMNHFLRNDIENIVIATMDSRSIASNMSEEEFRESSNVMIDRLAGPFMKALENHGFPKENVTILECGFQTDLAARMTEELLQTKKIGKKTAFITVSENSAVGICKVLKKYNWKSKDFIISIFDPISRLVNSVPGVIGVEISLDELLEQVTQALEYQFARNTNYVAGGVLKASFRKHHQL